MSEQRVIPGGRGGMIKPWDSESARQASLKRWEKASQAGRRGVAAAGVNIDQVNRRSALAVIEYAAEQHAMNMVDPSAPNSVQSFKTVLALAFPKPDRAGLEGSALNQVGGNEDIAELALLFRAWKAANPERAAALLAEVDGA